MDPSLPASHQPVPLTKLLFVVLVAGAMVWTWSLSMSWFGGWWVLRRAYPGDDTPPDEEWSGLSGHLGGWSGYYRNDLIVGVSEEGLHLRASRPFVVGHGPILVPWSEVEVGSREEAGWKTYIPLHLHRVERPLRLETTRIGPALHTIKRYAGRSRE